MLVHGVPYRTVWPDPSGTRISILDQTRLPHEFHIAHLSTLEEVCGAIRAMRVRGAPLIGATAAYGLALALAADPSPAAEERAAAALLATRPTAVNLAWAVARMRRAVAAAGPDAGARAAAARAEADRIADQDAAACQRIGEHGLPILRRLWEERRAHAPRLNVLTHCNAGWLATVDWGTALAPVYMAHDAGLPVHVWVDETRPRSQGASLTAWELGAHGVPHTLVADTAAGHLIQRGRVDVVLVGSDRTTARGDVANKIGTYLVALAAHAHGVPFYACVPVSSIDWSMHDGVREVPIEERGAAEVTTVRGRAADGTPAAVEIAPPGTTAANPAFDVTPARLVRGIVTEHGVFEASREGLARLAAALEAVGAREATR